MTTTTKINNKQYQGKPRIYRPVPGAPRVLKVYAWNPEALEYEHKGYEARRYETGELAVSHPGEQRCCPEWVPRMLQPFSDEEQLPNLIQAQNLGQSFLFFPGNRNPGNGALFNTTNDPLVDRPRKNVVDDSFHLSSVICGTAILFGLLEYISDVISSDLGNWPLKPTLCPPMQQGYVIRKNKLGIFFLTILFSRKFPLLDYIFPGKSSALLFQEFLTEVLD